MARPNTRAKNSSQHPGQIVLDTKQKRRTSEQKQADDAQAEELRQEQVEARAQGLKRIANILEHSTKEAEALLKNPPKPRPRVIKTGAAEPSVQPPKVHSEDRSNSQVQGAITESAEEEFTGDQQEDADVSTGASSTQAQSRKPRTQKTSTRDAVEDARRTLHEEGADVTDRQDKLGSNTITEPENGNQESARLNNEVPSKDNIAGVSKVKDWAEKLASSKLLHPSQLSCHTRSISTSGTNSVAASREPCPTPTSTDVDISTHAPTPTNEGIETQAEETDPYIQGSDQSERQAMPNPSSKSNAKRTGRMDVTEVISDSEPGEWVSPPPLAIEVGAKNANMVAKEGKGKRSKKRTHQREKSNEEESLPGAPPSKRAKSAPRSTSGSQRSGSGANKKYVKDDLPPGSTTDNVWRRLFISALAHFAGGYENPWAIPSDKFTSVLQVIWDTVYKGKITHSVTVNDPVYHVAKQNLNNWRSGFAAAATAVLVTFFASDSDFADPAARIEFAKAMLQRNRFLFSDNRGTDHKVWTGLWRGPLVLQTFAHHFNFIQGRVGITAIDKELAGPRAALALACASVCHMLTLVANNNVTFKTAKVWTAAVAKGSQYEFNESVWGPSTRRYLEPIKGLSNADFALVVDETQKYVKKPSLGPSAIDLDNEDSEYEDLFAFR